MRGSRVVTFRCPHRRGVVCLPNRIKLWSPAHLRWNMLSRPTSALGYSRDETSPVEDGVAPRERRPPPNADLVASKVFKVGLLLRRQGEPDAVTTLQRSLQINPSAPAVWKSLGHALAQDGKPRAAAAAFQTANCFR